MVNVVPREVPRPLGFWPCDLPRHSIHHDTPSAFPNNVPLYPILNYIPDLEKHQHFKFKSKQIVLKA